MVTIANTANKMSSTKRILNTADDIISHPASWLASGNHALAMYLSGWDSVDTVPTAIAAGIVFATITKASWQGYKSKLPFFVLGGLTLTTGFATAAEPFQELYQQKENLFEAFKGQLRTDLLGATALIGWGAGHIFTGLRNAADWAQNGISNIFKKVANLVNNKTSRNTNMMCYSTADISAVFSNPVSVQAGPLIPAMAGLARSFYNLPENLNDISSGFDRAMWHITPARLLATGYLINSAIALNSSNPDLAFAAISALWAIGTYNMDPKQNDHIRKSIGWRKEVSEQSPAP